MLRFQSPVFILGVCTVVLGCGNDGGDADDSQLPSGSGYGGAISGSGGYSPGNGGSTPGVTGGTKGTGLASGAGGSPGPGPGNGGFTGSSGGSIGAGGETPTTGGSTSTGGVEGSGGVIGGGGAIGSGGITGSGGAGPGTGGECLKNITDYGKAGPFQVTRRTVGQVKFWVPGVPAGCKVPVIHLANGTGASCATYGATLDRFASHGFLGACYESTQTGAGTQGIQAFDSALTTFPDLVDMRFGSTGHSQGGQSSFIVLANAEKKWGDKAIYAGFAMQPASGFGSQPPGTTWQRAYDSIRSPMFMFAGAGSDGLVSQSWVQSAFNAMNDATESYFWTCRGSSHIPVPNGETMQVGVPWFRWKLLGDQKACAFFKQIPKTDTRWVQQGVQKEQACQ